MQSDRRGLSWRLGDRGSVDRCKQVNIDGIIFQLLFKFTTMFLRLYQMAQTTLSLSAACATTIDQPHSVDSRWLGARHTRQSPAPRLRMALLNRPRKAVEPHELRAGAQTSDHRQKPRRPFSPAKSWAPLRGLRSGPRPITAQRRSGVRPI